MAQGHHRQKRHGARPKPEKRRKAFINTVKKTGKWRGVKKTLSDLK